MLSLLASSTLGQAGAVGAIVVLLIYLAVIVVVIAGAWKMFEKAGQPGWGAIIPIYNAYLMCKIVGRPGWWLILMFIPFVSLIVAIVVCNDMSKSFGRGIGTTLGLIFLGFVFVPILGFGSAEYEGPAAAM